MDQGLLPLYDARAGQTQSTPPRYATSLQGSSWAARPLYQSNSNNSNPTTPESFEGPYFGLDLLQNQALAMQGDLTRSGSISSGSSGTGTSLLHSKTNSESGSSFEELTSSPFNNGLNLPTADTRITTMGANGTPTNTLSASLSQRQFPHAVLAELHHQGHDLNQPLSHHMHPASASASTHRALRMNHGSVIPTFMAPPNSLHHSHHHHHQHRQQQQLLQHHREQQQQQLNLTHAMRSVAFTPDFHSFSAFGDSSPSMTMGDMMGMQNEASMLYGSMGNTDFANNGEYLEVHDFYGMRISMDEQMKPYTDNVPDLVVGGVHSGLSMGVGMSMAPPTGHGFSHGHGHGHSHGHGQAGSLGMTGNAALGMAISQYGRAQSRSSSTSTPSLACTSPQAIMSPPTMYSTTSSGSGPALFQSRQSAPPPLFQSNQSVPALFPHGQPARHVQRQSEDGSSSTSAPTAPIDYQNKNKTKKARKPSQASSSSSSSSSSSLSNTTPTIATSTTLLSVAVEPLAARVAALPKDKKRLFELACGDRWTQLSSSEATTAQPSTPPSSCTSSSQGLNPEDQAALRKKVHADLMLLEVFYALIGSEELATQQEIPDSLVRPVLESVPLPKATAKKGSRGGAAGYKCRWAGCSKELIKRLDHAKNHVREHCRSKPHTCGGGGEGQGVRGCGQKFLRMDDLKRHQRSHCSVLRSGPGRRPRSVRGVHRDTDEDDEDRLEEDEEEEGSISSVHGGDDDDYRPITRSAAAAAGASSSSSSAPGTSTRELATRLRNQRKRAAILHRRVVSSGSELSTVEDDEEDAREFGRLETSHVRGAPMEGARTRDDNDSDNSDKHGDDHDDRMEMRMDDQEEQQENGKAPLRKDGEL